MTSNEILPPVERASGLWRSETMSLLRLTMQREVAYPTIRKLGELGIAQFLDVTPEKSAFSRSNVETVRRCEDLERRIRMVDEELKKLTIQPPAEGADIHAGAVTIMNLDHLERRLDDFSSRLFEIVSRYRALIDRRNYIVQYQAVIDSLNVLLAGAPAAVGRPADASSPERVPLLAAEQGEASTMDDIRVTADSTLRYLVGVIPRSKLAQFERSAWRVTRGNVLIRTQDVDAEIVDTASGTPVPSCVFLAFFASTRAHAMVRRLATAVGAAIFDEAVTNANRAADVTRDLASELQGLDEATASAEDDIATFAALFERDAAGWVSFATQEKAIGSILNLCRWTASTAEALVWVPDRDMPRFRAAISAAAAVGSAQVPTLIGPEPTCKRTPPTYFRTNKVTSNFQQIVDSYGIATYKEVNPGVLTHVTFPFLFGIMFGDIGHGIIMFIMALLIVLFEKRLAKIPNEIFQLLFGGRYLVLFMSLFSIYIGTLYNDTFSLMLGEPKFKFHSATVIVPAVDPPGNMTINCMEFPVHWPRFGTNISVAQAACNARFSGAAMADPPGYGNGPVWGVDPAWAGANNKLDFYNSFKMKQAVILGVVHMLSGVFLSSLNHIANRRWAKLAFMFVPEVLFLACTFGWMDVLIIIKWFKDWPNPSVAPSLLNEMTNFFLSPGSPPTCYSKPGAVPTVTPGPAGASTCPIDEAHGFNFLFNGQFGVQAALLLIAFGSIPVLLFPMICIAKFCGKKTHAAVVTAAATVTAGAGENYVGLNADDETDTAVVATATDAARPAPVTEEHDDHDDHSFSEVVIHQIIHTIEYVLGCVSNTASYLRLWALSLAHAQLAEVFWQFTIEMPINMGTGSPGMCGIMLFVGFPVWFAVTIGVLVGMEGLSAFLHALRLHWVEFQVRSVEGNKFYGGEGVQFLPFTLELEDEDDAPNASGVRTAASSFGDVRYAL